MWKLRKARIEDAKSLIDLRTRAILWMLHDDNISYHKKQIESWASKPPLEPFMKLIIENYFIICETEVSIIGCGYLDIKNRSIEAMYVLPSMHGCGIGKLIIESLLTEARRLELSYVTLISALNAVSYYRSLGFSHNNYTTHTLDDGQEIDCAEMKIKF